MEYGEKIASLRKAKGMTQAELGKELNVTYQAVSKWERNESEPDFSTLSKMAKIFGVAITYFEDEESAYTAPYINTAPAPAMLGVCLNCGKAVYEGQAGSTSPALLCIDCAEKLTTDFSDIYNTPAPAPTPAMLGVCTVCGKVIYEGNEGETEPALICTDCVKRRDEAKKATIQEKRLKAQRQEEAAKRSGRRMRNKGLIVSGVINGILLIFTIVGLILNPENLWEDIGYSIVGLIFLYTFVAQLFWRGAVVKVCVAGLRPLSSLSGWGGFVVIIIFGLIIIPLCLLILLICLFVAVLISPFSFIPELIKLNRGILT